MGMIDVAQHTGSPYSFRVERAFCKGWVARKGNPAKHGVHTRLREVFAPLAMTINKMFPRTPYMVRSYLFDRTLSYFMW